jgi:hypothetical protein
MESYTLPGQWKYIALIMAALILYAGLMKVMYKRNIASSLFYWTEYFRFVKPKA